MRHVLGPMVGLMSLVLVGAAWADSLRVGVSGLPRAKGHPYAVSNLPAIYTFTAIFDALTYVNAEGQIEPWLATKWQQTSPTTWVFDLRKDVLFHNGTPLTAEDVVASVAYLTSEQATGDTIAAELSTLQEARALGPHQVEITTKTPNPILDREVSALRVVPGPYWREVGPEGFAQAPIGSGPFAVQSWDQAGVDLNGFADSWRPPNFARMEIRLVPEALSRVQGLLSGGLDVAVGLSAEDAPLIEASGHNVDAVPGTGVFVMAFNAEKDPRFRDVRVRQALNYAVDKERMIDVLLGGRVKQATQFTPPNALGYVPDLEPYPYNPEKARSLLAEAGYSEGFDFVFEGVPSGSVSGGTIFQQVAQDLSAIGVNMEIRPLQLFQLSAHMHNGTWEGSAFGIDYGTAPSQDTLRSLRLHSCLWKKPWYCDTSLQPVVEQALSVSTVDLRKALSQRIMRRYHEQVPGILLWNITYFMGYREDIEGFDAVGTWIVYDRLSRMNN